MTATVQPAADGITLAGHLDPTCAAACEARGRELIRALAPATTPIYCDISGLSSGNSLTAAVLMSWRRAAQAQGRALYLKAIPPRLHAILEAGNLLPVFLPQS